MPTYQYRCTECGHDLEVVQKFTDAALTECPNCAGSLRKVFNAVGVVFRGSGFYRTDSRAGDKSGTNGSEKSEGGGSDKASERSSGADKGGEKSGQKKASQPAASGGHGIGSAKQTAGAGSSTGGASGS